MKALILAGGRGLNLNPFTITRPKSMIYTGGRYILDNLIYLLQKAGINDLHLIVGHEKDKIIEHYAKDEVNINIHFIHQEDKDSIGDAIILAKDRFSKGEYFLLVYGDIVVSSNIFTNILGTFHSFKTAGASICLPSSSKMFGNVFLDSKMNIKNVIEKPMKNNMANYVLAGVFVLPTHIFSILEKKGGSMEVALSELINTEDFKASIWEDNWIDVCYPWDILEANHIIMDSWTSSSISNKADIEGNVTIKGPVVIEDDVVIRAGAVVYGPSFIGKGSYIGNNSLIREYTSIGPACMIGYGVELKNCVIFGKSKIGRLSFVGDSILGEHVELGANIVTVNRDINYHTIKVTLNNELKDTGLVKLGAFIGDNVKIGSSNTIKEGSMIQPNVILNSTISFPRD